MDESKIGANPSAEEGGEAAEASSVSGCDIILAHRLSETSFTKKTYATYIKGMEGYENSRLTRSQRLIDGHTKSMIAYEG